MQEWQGFAKVGFWDGVGRLDIGGDTWGRERMTLGEGDYCGLFGNLVENFSPDFYYN